jgi:hypothetical protein
MQRSFWTAGAAALVVISSVACSAGGDKLVDGKLSMTGAVHKSQLADGTECWQFVSTSGKQYELQPAQAPKELLVDGQQTSIVAKPLSGGGSFCKVGTLISVVRDTATAAAPAPAPAKS